MRDRLEPGGLLLCAGSFVELLCSVLIGFRGIYVQFVSFLGRSRTGLYV